MNHKCCKFLSLPCLPLVQHLFLPRPVQLDRAQIELSGRCIWICLAKLEAATQTKSKKGQKKAIIYVKHQRDSRMEFFRKALLLPFWFPYPPSLSKGPARFLCSLALLPSEAVSSWHSQAEMTEHPPASSGTARPAVNVAALRCGQGSIRNSIMKFKWKKCLVRYSLPNLHSR